MKRLLIAITLALCTVQVAEAADAVSSQVATQAPALSESSSWAIQTTAYLWAAGLKGDISPFRRAPTIGIEKSFPDILHDLNFGGFANIYARYERFIVSGDAMYVNTTDSKAIGALPVIGPTPGLGVGVDTKEFNATLMGGYRIFAGSQFSLDALAGARIWHISNDVTAKYGPFLLSYGEGFGWVDPVVGARAFYRITDTLSLLAQADVGGFDVSSRFTWQALGTLNYSFSDHLTASVGYKVLRTDFHRGGYVFDATLKGPVVGLTYRF